MKKILIFLVLCLSLTACSGQTPTNNTVEELEPVDAPVLSYDEDTGLVYWESVEHATHYNYIINDEDVETTTSLSIKLKEDEVISVQAANDEYVSEWSNPIANCDTSVIYEEETLYAYVKFHNSNVKTKKVELGEVIAEPAAPTKENYTFDNWYADPFYQEVFDFAQPIYSNTIIYANYLPNDLIADTYFWVKGDSKMTAQVMSGPTSSGWHFMPMKLNQSQQGYKEFFLTVTVTGASSTSPCAFIVMDGFKDDGGRTYWKNNNSDFTITSDGTYNIKFSVEHQYAKDIHVTVEAANNTAAKRLYDNDNLSLDTPIVSIDSTKNKASWNKVSGASRYEVVVDNGEIIETTKTSIDLEKGSHITVRAINGMRHSKWSTPKANREHVVLGSSNNICSVYFVGYDSYQVEVNETINAKEDLSKEGFTFGGWYLDVDCTKKATFPYKVTTSVVFYPKWTYKDSDYKTKVYYNLVTENNTLVTTFTWNLDNYTFIEYESKATQLTTGTNYYVVSTDNPSIKYGPYKVDTTQGYVAYFSEENLWGDSNIYFASTIKTVYFSAPTGWTDTIYIYVWNNTSNLNMGSWPGVQMTYLETNEYGQKIYKIDIDYGIYDHIIFTHGVNGTTTGSQSVDISLTENKSNGFYLTDKITTSDGKQKYQFGTYSR